jgi:hypothetical protein
MNKSRLVLLVKVQVLALFGINKALKSEDKSENRIRVQLGLGIILVAYFLWMSYAYSNVMAKTILSTGVGSLDTIPATMMMASSLLILLSGIYQGGKTLFKYKDYDMVMSLPVRSSTIAASRIAILYVYELMFVLIMMLPAGLVYGYYSNSNALYYLVYIILLLITPIVPLVISSIIGTALLMVSSRFKRSSNIVNIILTFILVVGIMVMSSTMPDSEAAISASATSIANSFGKYYPLLNVFLKAVCELDIVSIITFPLVSITLFAAFCLIIAKRYRNICNLISSIGGKAREFSKSDIKESSILKSLYRREMRQYFSSTVYVTNTAIGAVLGLLFCAVVMMNNGMPQLSGMTEEEIRAINGFIITLAPVFLSMFIGMSGTTGSSISIEGSKLWILKALPVQAYTIYMAKILVSLTITVPASLICSVLLALGLKIQGLNLILLFIIPLVFAVFSALFGIIINLRFPKLDWQTETQVVKQSLAAALSIFVPMLYCLASMTGLIILMINISGTNYNQTIWIFLSLITLIPLIAAVIIWRILKKNGEKKFKLL